MTSLNVRMGKRKILIVVVVLFILGLTTLCSDNQLHTSESNKKQETSSVVNIKLTGQGKLWRVEDYTIIKTDDSIFRGGAKLIFLGDKTSINESNHLKYTFYEYRPRFDYVSVVAGEKTSENGTISIFENVDELGSNEGPISDYERQMSEEGFENSIVVIEWTNNSGELQKETIELSK